MSKESNSQQPEIIDICSYAFSKECTSQNCILLIGVVGNSESMVSKFNIIVHAGNTKLNSTEARNGTIQDIGGYHYYWFINLKTRSEGWANFWAVNLKNKDQDVDIYVSFGDGRPPTENDYDWKSNLKGADFLSVNSSNAHLNGLRYPSQIGIFVVGVRAVTEVTNYALVSIQEELASVSTTQLFKDSVYTFSIARGEKKYYRFFNWGFEDFRFHLQPRSDDGVLFGFLNF